MDTVPQEPVSGIEFVKGHGTENDFVLIPDADDALSLSDEFVRAVCHRRRGPGADGMIRVVRTAGGSFFMDYRNADSSIAEMCGNGARVFARFLVDAGWAAPGVIEFGTRAGTKVAHVQASGDVTVEMGPVRIGVTSEAVVFDPVEVPRTLVGTTVDVGNPHLVCWVEDSAGVDLSALDLSAAPAVDATVFPDGANVEFVTPVLDAAPGIPVVEMRVHERGSGETRSCGTGTVAVAAVTLARAGLVGGTVEVRVPGGTVVVEIADGTARLTGPAELSYSGTLNPALFG